MVTPISQQRKVQNNIISIRPFKKSDFVMVEAMDERSGNDVAQWVNDLEDGDSNDYSWGCFLEEELIGYCTIGYADTLYNHVHTYPGYTVDSLLLSDVFIKKEYRGNGYALQMIEKAIRKRRETENELVFLTLLYDDLHYLYQKLGFHWVFEEKYLMVLEKEENC